MLDSADAHLWVREHEVCFDLQMHVTVPRAGAPSPSTPIAAAPQLPAGMVFVCCDDDEIPRIFAESVILPATQADLTASRVVGETYAEAVGVPDLVMALAAEYGHERVYGLFDQNLTSYDEGAIFGTSMCRELRQRGFRGALVIQSANDELSDASEYLAAGANGCVAKALKGGPDELLRQLAQLWVVAERGARESSFAGVSREGEE